MTHSLRKFNCSAFASDTSQTGGGSVAMGLMCSIQVVDRELKYAQKRFVVLSL